MLAQGPEVEKYVNKNDFEFLKKVKPGLTDFSSILFSREDKVLKKLGGLNSYESVSANKIRSCKLLFKS